MRYHRQCVLSNKRKLMSRSKPLPLSLRQRAVCFDRNKLFPWYRKPRRYSRSRSRRYSSVAISRSSYSHSSIGCCHEHRSNRYERSQSQQSMYNDINTSIGTSNLRNTSLNHDNDGDDDDGYLKCVPGDVLDRRYEIRQTLGQGTFGKVMEVRNLHHQPNVRLALKLIKNVDKYRKAAQLEINVLKTIKERDPDGINFCITLYDSFTHDGHMCLVFEKQGSSLFDFLEQNDFIPYPIDQIRHISYQLCQAVKYLHSISLTHTDLKPENILFVNSAYDIINNYEERRYERRVRRTDIKVIDFGSATFDWEDHSRIVSTRHYRAPEVILELGWSQPCDVWSIGCILFEIYSGSTLFQTHDNMEHLAMMEHVLGSRIPYRMVKDSKKKNFFNKNRLDWNPCSSAGRHVNKKCKPLREYMLNNGQDQRQLFDLIDKMLEYDPKRRITSAESVQHSFCQKYFL